MKFNCIYRSFNRVNETKNSRMNQVKLVETSFKSFEVTWSLWS